MLKIKGTSQSSNLNEIKEEIFGKESTSIGMPEREKITLLDLLMNKEEKKTLIKLSERQ